MAIYTFGCYTFYVSPPDYRLSISDLEIKSEFQQLQLLAFFVEHPDELITKDRLKRPIWGGHAEDQTVGSAVSRLKKMLKERGDGQEYIQVLPKMGYRLACGVTSEVDRSPVGMKELTQTSKSVIETLSNHGRIIYPGVGWGGVVLTVGTRGVEFQIPETPSKLDRGFREMVSKLRPEHIAGIFFEFAQRAAPNLLGRDQTTWLDYVEGEYWGYGAALDYYGTTDAKKELEMAVNLAPYWNERALWTEGRERLRQALAHQSESVSEIKARALIWYGHLCYHLDDYKTAKESLSQGAAMCKKVGDQLNYTHALFLLGSVAEVEGSYPEAKTFHNRCIKAGEKIKANQYLGGAYRGLASTALTEGDVLGAKDLYFKGLTKYEQAEDHRCVANCYSRLSVVALAQRDIPQARLMWERSNDPGFGVPGKQSVALAEFNKGLLEEQSGHPEAALIAYQKSFLLRHQIGEKRGTAKAMEAVARVGAKMGQEKESAMILGAAEALRESTAAPMSPAEKRGYKKLVTDLKKRFPNEFQEGSRRVLEDFIPVV